MGGKGWHGKCADGMMWSESEIEGGNSDGTLGCRVSLTCSFRLSCIAVAACGRVGGGESPYSGVLLPKEGCVRGS